jgi:hypothetical protein
MLLVSYMFVNNKQSFINNIALIIVIMDVPLKVSVLFFTVHNSIVLRIVVEMESERASKGKSWNKEVTIKARYI